MPHRILVVDADPASLNATESILADAHYLVTATTDFAAAKQRLLLAPPDLLMADVRLGTFNGLHLVHIARMNHPEISAIITDRSPDPTLKEEAARAQANYMLKPLKAAALTQTVRDMLADRPAEPGTETMRQWARKSAGLLARFDDIPVTLADLSYGGLRLEVPRKRGELLQRGRGQLTVPNVGSIPVRVVWGRNASAHGPAWCGAEILSDAQQASVRNWRTFVDSI
jgi:DNA-binding response OmpR family regulator